MSARSLTWKSEMKKPKRTVAGTTSAFAKAFAPHPLQSEFLEAAIARRAEALASSTADPLATDDAMARAKADFSAALQALIYEPEEDRLYAIWANVTEAKVLAACVVEAWAENPGVYGQRPPQNWLAKK
jgi:ABC-type sugar transport system substrate-binding protein